MLGEEICGASLGLRDIKYGIEFGVKVLLVTGLDWILFLGRTSLGVHEGILRLRGIIRAIGVRTERKRF